MDSAPQNGCLNLKRGGIIKDLKIKDRCFCGCYQQLLWFNSTDGCNGQNVIQNSKTKLSLLVAVHQELVNVYARFL